MDIPGNTRNDILTAALNRFAASGYAGTSVQDIVNDARVTKPTLYYYFPNKAGLYQALVDSAHDERLRLMQEAVERGETLQEKLVEILTALFAFTRDHKELMRMAFATAFSSPDGLPKEIDYTARCMRNFEFLHTLIKQGLADGTLDPGYDSKELAFGIHGLMNVYLMAHVVLPDCALDRSTAEQVVHLFLSGAAARTSATGRSEARRSEPVPAN